MGLPANSKPGLSPELLRILGPTRPSNREEAGRVPSGWAPLDGILPDGGFVRGTLSEISTSPSLGRATSIALRVCASAQREGQLRGGEPAWCAWLDPSCTLYAPGVAAHGVVLERLLVVRPEAEGLARMAVRVIASRVFSVVVVDTLGVIGAQPKIVLRRWSNVVRRMALALEGSDTAAILLTDREQSNRAGLPTALRLEVMQVDREYLEARVAKERRGRIGPVRSLAYTRPNRNTDAFRKGA